MIQCLRVGFSLIMPKNFLQDVVQKQARLLQLEGTAQAVMGEKTYVKIVVCGKKELIDEFIDSLHQILIKYEGSDLMLEPFIKDKEYRGVFRIIE